MDKDSVNGQRRFGQLTMNYLRRLASTWRLFLLVFTLVVGLGFLALQLIDDTYESGAKLVLERADEFVFGDDSPDAETLSQRVHLIISNVFRRENISKILEETNVISADTDEIEKSEAIDLFVERARIEFDNVSTINSNTGRLGLMSLGLDIVYRDNSPETAYQITNLLMNDVLAGSRSRSTTGDTVNSAENFLTQELEITSKKLIEIEQKISSFKNNNALSLPELYPVTIRELQDISDQIERTKSNVADLQRSVGATTTDLAITNPDALLVSDDGTRIESVDERLQQLNVEFTFAASRYSADHPEVVRLDREISALQQHSSGSDTRLLEVELNGAQALVLELQERYSETHPDVLAAKRSVNRLNTAIQSTAASSAPRSSSQPSNPAYVRLQARADGLDAELNRELRLLQQLEGQQIRKRELLATIPDVELELGKLERAQNTEELRHTELEQQLTAAMLSSSMRGADLLGQLIVIDPPAIALKPVAPRRKLLFALLLVLGFGAATAAALVSLFYRDAIWESKELSSLVKGRVVQVPRF